MNLPDYPSPLLIEFSRHSGTILLEIRKHFPKFFMMDTDRREIRRLSPEIIRLIAAGKVIERPMSVVKELIENSLDAGARQIDVRLINGGLTAITVRDDGAGIPASEIPLLLERHTTSKIGDEIDLGNILTLGFRGEALYSIASVSEMILSTRFRDDEIGSRLCATSGERKIDQIPWPGGTQVESIGLFSATPARRKFLRSASAEYARVAELISAYCLAYPNVSFRLSHDGRETLRTSGSGSMPDALLAVFGADIARKMLPVSFRENDVSVSGSVSGFDITRARRTDQFTFLNGRLIKDPSISAAFERAYDPFLAPGRHPLAVVTIECDTSEVDVNVHPHKREVRFAHPGVVAGAVNRAVKMALAKSYTIEPPPAKSPPAIDEITGEVLINDGTRPRELMPSFSSLREDREWGLREAKRHHTSDWPESERQSVYIETHYPKTSDSGVQHIYPSFDEIGVDDSLEPSGNTLQFANTYIIYNRGKTVYLIDQHNLHERILFEEFQRRRERSDVLTQTLLFPLQVRLTPSLAGLVHAHHDELAALGFDIEEFSGGAGGQSFVLRGVPQEIGSSDPATVLTDCLERVSHDEAISEPGGFKRAFDTNLACKSAIKAGHPLTEREIEFLIGHIEDGTFYTCPHGRPAVIRLDEEWFRKIFKR